MSDSLANGPGASRIQWVDVAKGLGIGLVFYGHFVERYIALGLPAAVEQMRWIYAFHMPLFFFLSGFVYKDRDLKFDAFLKRQILTRLVPVWLFMLIGIPLWILAHQASTDAGWAALTQRCLTEAFWEVVRGRPHKNVLVWFLVCLFTAELLQFGLRRLVRRTPLLVLSILFFAGLTHVISDQGYREAAVFILTDRIDSWHLTSAIAAIVFYQMGILTRRLGLLVSPHTRWYHYLFALATLAVTLLTYNLNDVLGYRYVRLIDAAYGYAWWFFLTALAGALLVACLAQILSRARVLTHLGQITLALMCLNGIIHEYANPAIATALLRLQPDQNVLILTAVCLGMTIVQLALCVPVAWLLHRLLPAIFGRGAAKPAAAPSPVAAGAAPAGK